MHREEEEIHWPLEHRNWLEVQPGPIPGILRGTLFLHGGISATALLWMESAPNYGHGRDTSNCSSVDTRAVLTHQVKSVCYHQSCTLQYALIKLQLTQDICFYNGIVYDACKVNLEESIYIRWLKLCETLVYFMWLFTLKPYSYISTWTAEWKCFQQPLAC